MRMAFYAVAWAYLASGLLPSTGRAQASACVGQELSRSRLIVEGGRELYIESHVFAPSGRSILLAGKPSYLFFKRDPDATGEVESRHTVFGAILGADGSARTVTAPPVNGGRATALAGLDTGEGSWRVIFAEMDSIADPKQRLDAVWHGIFDGRQWSALERLPLPPGKPLHYFNASPLAQHGDTVVWAALVDVGGNQQGVTVFERIGGTWSQQVIATPFAGRVEAIHTMRLGFVLAIEQSDAEAARGESVFLYTRQSGWKQQRKIPIVETDGSALQPSNAANEWRADGDSVRLIVGFSPLVTTLGNREEPLLAVGRSLGEGFATVALRDGTILWATEYADSSGTPELRLVLPVTGSSMLVWRSPNPFRGGLSAVASSPSEVLIVGPELDETHGVLTSLILRIRVQCGQGRLGGN